MVARAAVLDLGVRRAQPATAGHMRHGVQPEAMARDERDAVFSIPGPRVRRLVWPVLCSSYMH